MRGALTSNSLRGTPHFHLISTTPSDITPPSPSPSQDRASIESILSDRRCFSLSISLILCCYNHKQKLLSDHKQIQEMMCL
ncbi:hypothetical protein L6452_01332 [Arctium lappa]|uniref:Uncharacterized protein n=1 Tax=Arctium lappa TaxID=4217 RepID=A0ACB9FGC9_ARCLA|nr:hypothetical protein L6452_01332 [Arctium lappa]